MFLTRVLTEKTLEMNHQVYLIFTILITTRATPVPSGQQNRAAVVLSLFNEKLYNFFESFLSPYEIDKWSYPNTNVPLEKTRALDEALVPYSTLRGEIIRWCSEMTNTLDILDHSSDRLQKVDWFALKVLEALQEMQTDFNKITTDNNTRFNDRVKEAKEIIVDAIEEISVAANDIYNREDMVTKCRPVLNPPTTTSTLPPPAPATTTSWTNCGISVFTKKPPYFYTALLIVLHYAAYYGFFST